jgi:NADH-quinone oxidoreductase subunit E
MPDVKKDAMADANAETVVDVNASTEASAAASGEGPVGEIVARYQADAAMILPMLQDLQQECGYLPPVDVKYMAKLLSIPVSRIYSVAMFYSTFRFAPKGDHDVTLCMGTVCHQKGAPDILDTICKKYEVEPGGTTSDRLFTLMGANCVGACTLAPVMIVDETYHDGVTPESALEILGKLESKGVVNE